MTAEQDLSPLKRAFLAIEQLQGQLEAVRGSATQPIAIVGVGCRLPGSVSGLDDLWACVRDGVDAIGEVPPDRWDIDAYYDADHRVPGKMSTRHGGFVDHPDRFEPELFGIAPREAAVMDPQQRLLLEVGWEALEHAGIAPSSLAGSRTGVFVGMATSDYAQMMLDAQGIEGLDAYYASGTAHSIASGRLSYVLGLVGPSMSVDTACSSSLLAVHLAVQSLRSGESDLALAGGVNLILSPEMSVTLSKYQMMSPEGRCKFGDATADGFVRAEGCAVVVLKRLPDALADGDRVLAVIRGSAVTQDGASSGLTAPNGPAQESVVRAALRNARVEPGAVDYVEAHGTGTALGDPIELQALGEVFGPGRPADRALVVGSVKTNLGHLESAAGVTGLVKVVAMLQHAAIPASLHFRNPTPEFDWDELPIIVPTSLRGWSPSNGRRTAGVSSFGFSGTNVHVVVEGAPAPAEDRGTTPDRPAHVLALSARTGSALGELAGRYAAHLRANPDVPLADIAHTAATGRSHLAHRMAVVAADAATAAASLDDVAAGRPAAGTVVRDATRTDPPKVAFLFTGQGSQRVGMARELYESSPVVRGALDRCAAIVADQLDLPLLDVIFAAEGDPAAGLLDETAYTQPALVAIEYALAELWRSWGVVPNAVLGHSIGEYAAAVAAGVMGIEDGMRLAAERGRLMQGLSIKGAMAAVFAPARTVAAAVEAAGGSLTVAADNGPSHSVVAGAVDDVERLVARLSADGIRAQRLNVSHAFHSALVEPMLDGLEAAAAPVQFSSPRVRLASNVTGASVERGTIDAAYWRRQARAPVRFADGVAELDRLGCEIFVEIGPHPTLLTMAQAVLPDRTAWLATLRRGRGDWQQLLSSVGELYTLGVAVDWAGYDRPWQRRTVTLPTYPFQRERHWFEPEHARRVGGRPAGRRTPTGSTSSPGHPILGVRLRSAMPQVQFDCDLAALDVDFVADHRVFGTSIMPATGFIEAALAAGARAVPGGSPGAIVDLELSAALVLGDTTRALQTIVTPNDGDGAPFEILSSGDDGETWELHARGRIERAEPLGARVDVDAVRNRSVREVDGAEHYAGMAERGLEFGPSLRGLRRVWIGDSEALGEVASVAGPGPYRIHPALLDACLQTFAPISPAGGLTYLPIAIDRVDLAEDAESRTAAWAHATLRPDRSNGQLVTGDLVVADVSGVPIATIRGVRFKRADLAAVLDGSRDGLAGWLYERVWDLTPLAADAAPLAAPVVMIAAAEARSAQLSTDVHLAGAQRLYDELDELSASYTVAALADLGATTGGSFTLADLDVAPRHHSLAKHLCARLAANGRLKIDGEGWMLGAAPATADLAALADLAVLAERLEAEHPYGKGEVEIVRRCGEQLAGALRGGVDPLQLLFPGGSTQSAEAMYHGSPFATFYNGIVAEAVTAAVPGGPAARPLRILEIGAGTLGTTTPIMARLSDGRVDYTISDISPLFVERARERFADHPGVSFHTLDIESDPLVQGFSEHGYDVIVAANVLHATSDLRRTFGNVATLMAPGGRLVLLEMTTPRLFIDITFGLTPGWWLSTDADLRAGYPLLDRNGWTAFLQAEGFTEVDVAPDPTQAASVDLEHQSVFVAGAPRRARSDAWLVIADRGGVGDRLGELLRAAGASVTVVPHGDDPDVATLVTAAPQGGWAGVVHLTSLDPSTGTPLDTAEVRTGSALSIVQAMLAQGGDARLWLVTRGGQPVAGDTADATQAPLWGLGMVAALEHPELRCTCIDLDPSPGDDPAAVLFDELVAGSNDRQIGHRSGRRFVARVGRIGTSFVPAVHGRDATEPTSALAVRPGASGSFDDLTMQDALRRPPGPGEVEIRVHAAGLNFRDVMNALAMRDDHDLPGSECAGRVVAVGDGVSDLVVGDDVVAVAAGSFAGYVVAPAALVVPKPATLTYDEAATVPLAFLTAWYALHGVARVQPGDTVLVHAAAGGVGLAAIQVAQRAGATVIGSAGTPHKRAHLATLGIAGVTDSRSAAFVADVLQHTGGRGVDIVLNSLTGELLDRSLDVLAPGGRFVELGKREILDPAIVAAEHRGAVYSTITLADDVVERPELVGALLRRIMASVDAGELQALPVQSFPMADAAAAFRFMAQARHIGKVVLTNPDARMDLDVHPIRGDGAYVVTGGLAGVGLLVAEWLVEQGARHLALVARSEPSDGASAAIARMELRGARVLTVAADVSDREQVVGLLQRIGAELAPLRGVFHAAGVLADGGLVRQDWARFAAVLAPKVEGATHLDELTRGCDLDHFVLFSSAASLFGSAGQANHAAANAFLDALAARRCSLGLPALSVNWGAWADVGSVVRQDVEERIGAQGVVPMAPGDALAMLGVLMTRGLPQVGVIAIDWSVYLRQAGQSGPPPWLAGIARSSRRTTATAMTMATRAEASAAAATTALRDAIVGAPAARRRDLLLDFVAAQVRRVLGVAPDRSVDERLPLHELGLDSLMAVELRNLLGAGLAFDKPLPATLVFDRPTIDALADDLDERLGGRAADPAPPVAGDPATEVADAGTDLLDSLELLSDEDVARLLDEGRPA